jgi:glycosyltransferase involved in cell wall biosynthesis
MNLTFITPSFYPATYYGGPIYSLYHLAKVLAKRGIKVYAVTTNANGDKRLNVITNKFTAIAENLFVKYYAFSTGSGFSPFMFLFLWNDIRKADIIYLVSVFSPPTPLTIILAALFRKKIILSPRGQLGDWCLNQGNKLKKLWLIVFIKPFLKKIIWNAASLQEKDMIIKVFPGADVFIIPNSIDLAEFDKETGGMRDYRIYKELSGKDVSGKIILVSLGRLHKVKGFDILINAFDRIKNQFADIVLFIAGNDYGEKKALSNLIKELRLEERVFLINNIEGENKVKFLKNADLFVLASHHENFGIAYAEAMAAGLPIVASVNTPWKEIEQYGCGKWVNNTSEDFAEAITDILKSDNKNRGKRAREFVSDRFNPDIIAGEYEKIFKLILPNS